MEFVVADSPENIKILSTPAIDVKLEEIEDVYYLALDLFPMCTAMNGLGLSANQIGDNRNYFIINTPDLKLICINAKIVDHTRADKRLKEGCLSRPNEFCLKMRWKGVTIEYLNKKGEVERRELTGLEAQVAQHEINHMEGILI